jgi:hypothetical protein
MSKLPLHARGQLSTPTARDTARQKKADLVQQELDAEKITLEERLAQLRATRLARENDRS